MESIDKYEILDRIAEGAHGIVLKAKKRKTEEIVAIKKIAIKNLDEYLSVQQFREIQALQHLDHQNDIKPSNLLISAKGVLKIADFGLARLNLKRSARPFTHQVASRWYRAPELLYGARSYDEAVDLWAAGCVLAELLNRQPLFPGESDIDQIVVIYRILGSPTEEIWPGMNDLPDYAKITFPEYSPVPWSDVIQRGDTNDQDLVANFVVYDPAKRISAKKALDHLTFFTSPLPTPVPMLPKPRTSE